MNFQIFLKIGHSRSKRATTGHNLMQGMSVTFTAPPQTATACVKFVFETIVPSPSCPYVLLPTVPGSRGLSLPEWDPPAIHSIQPSVRFYSVAYVSITVPSGTLKNDNTHKLQVGGPGLQTPDRLRKRKKSQTRDPENPWKRFELI